MTSTVFLKIPKEKVVNKITEEHAFQANIKDNGDIRIVEGSAWCATLEDYKITRDKISTENMEAEAGNIGTKMEYQDNARGNDCRRAVSDYEF